MIKTILHLFKIHRKVIFGNPTIIIQNMLGVTPKSINAVDVVLTSASKGFATAKLFHFRCVRLLICLSFAFN
jgi:hypothetical protein